MKALPKRKGNFPPEFLQELQGSSGRLNESPSEKEGKFGVFPVPTTPRPPSMKVPPKRKGNLESKGQIGVFSIPQ